MKPILFNSQMVRAILDGRKTQTRRIVKTGSYTPLEVGRSKFYTFRDELNGKPGAWAGFYRDEDVFVGSDGKQHIDAVYAKAPYQPGDVLYVRETWKKVCATERYYEGGKVVNSEELFGYMYRADNLIRWDEREPKDDEFHLSDITRELKWRPSIHMPREAARIFLRVTDVRVERLQHITRADAISEGCNAAIPVLEFQGIWDTTIKAADRDRYGWAADPWVWVISFERCGKEGEPWNG